MSQEKVDKYKKDKANRQKIIKKEKREKMLWKVGGYVVLIALVCWIGFSAYDKYHVEVRATYEVDTTALDDYTNDLSTAEAEARTLEPTTPESEAESETEAGTEETTEASSEEETGTESASETESETETVSETESETETASETESETE